jgi:O-antigen ligase
VSPGSFSFYNDLLLVPLTAWRPITVSPGDTVRGLGFLFGLSLLYGAVFREFAATRWRRRLAGTVVAVGFAITFLGLFQEAASNPPKMYGFWAVADAWALFGPYANRNHFAGYMVMAIPLGMAFAIDALRALGRAWAGRRRGWLALGGPEAAAFLRHAVVAMVLVVGLVASGSRGGFVAFVVSTPALAFAFRKRLRAALVATVAVFAIAAAGVSWVGLEAIVWGFESRGLQVSRLDLWRDMLPMFPHFPVLGAGLNGFGMAYLRYQTIWRSLYFGYAHNDYLQALLELGAVGAALVAALLAALFRGAVRSALRVPFEAGVLGALVALATHALVDFNWQIPANAATYVALAGLAMRGAARLDPSSPRH